MRITELNIERFRHLANLNIEIGTRLTAIAGQNGTGKSTILGLLGHPCKLKPNIKTFDNKKFETEYSEIFKFSYPDYDKPKEHLYSIYFDDGDSREVTSSVRTENNTLRLALPKKAEQGKVNYPVIYLGLKRLIPLAQESKIDIVGHTLTPDEQKFFSFSHNQILLLNDKVSTEAVKARTKHFVAAKTDKYDAIGNSAGQDNIGQIITAIISFQRLKTKLGDEYRGGLLLIDELDATLFPAAQKKLIEFLFKQSSNLDLQIVFTTHSLEILEQLMTIPYSHQAKVCYLHNTQGSIKVAEENNLMKIIADLKVEVVPRQVQEKKVEIYLEDKEAQQFLKAILIPALSKKIRIQNTPFGCRELEKLAKRKIPAFKQSIFVLDGDVSKTSIQNIVILPGSNSPEKIIFNFLKNLNQDHELWGGLGEYTRQVCFKDQSEIGDREQMKKWWLSQVKYWGVNGKTVIKVWAKENEKEVERFLKDFGAKIDKILMN